MRLQYVQIKNYRSISDITLPLEPRCRVLVGINEAGKTNILKALSLLDPDAQILPSDKREPRPGEPYDQEAYVKFVFVFDEQDRTIVESKVRSRLLLLKKDTPLVSINQESLSLSQFTQQRTGILYKVNLKTHKRNLINWALPSNAQLVPGWKKLSPSCPPEITLKTASGEGIQVSNYSLIYSADFPEFPVEYLTDAGIEDISSLLDTEAKSVASSQIPSCVYWTYSEANLLPGQVSLSSFMSNPDSCLPLKYMFLLAGIENIQTELTEAQSRSNGIRNLLKRVSELSTNHMRAVWPEYKRLSISLQPNGDSIEATIQDKHNQYDMSRRSDGFKRFISFLLLVSAKVKTDSLTNTLYLHDEPESSLHPSGARHLRDELIKISEKNYVVYATHSIFMIDPELINRHTIVIKEDEVTTIKEVSESDISDEEVIYNALSYSIFQNLKKDNIIFEGWRDKRLFSIAMNKLPAKSKSLRSIYSPLGKCHAKGAKDIARIASILQLGDRNFVIISDCDAPAKEHQTEFQNEYRDKKHWWRYDELISNVVVTGEDFIRADAFQPAIEMLRAENPKLSILPAEKFDDVSGRLVVISNWLLENGYGKPEIKTETNRIKEYVFSNLTPEQILPLYYEVLTALAPHISS